MFGVKPLLLGTLVGAGVVGFVDRYYTVQTDDGWAVVEREHQPSLLDSYADVRGWSTADWADKPELARALVNGGKQDVLIDGVGNGLLKDATDALGFAPEQSGAGNGAAIGQGASGPAIIFGNKPKEGTGSSAPPTTNAGSSLLDRLQRQLQSNDDNRAPVTTNGSGHPVSSTIRQPESNSSFTERPLERTIDRFSTSVTPPPEQPSASLPSFPAADEIRIASLNRAVRSAPRDIERVVAPLNDTLEDKRGTEVVSSLTEQFTNSFQNQSQSALRDTGNAILDKVLDQSTSQSDSAVNLDQPADGFTRGLIREIVSNPAGSMGDIDSDLPLEIDRTRLQEQIPASIGNQLRSLVPRPQEVPSAVGTKVVPF